MREGRETWPRNWGASSIPQKRIRSYGVDLFVVKFEIRTDGSFKFNSDLGFIEGGYEKLIGNQGHKFVPGAGQAAATAMDQVYSLGGATRGKRPLPKGRGWPVMGHWQKLERGEKWRKVIGSLMST